MQVSRQGEREEFPQPFCHFDLRKCIARPDALKDYVVGQLVSLKVALHCNGNAYCLRVHPSASPMQLRLLLGRTHCLNSHMKSWCVKDLP